MGCLVEWCVEEMYIIKWYDCQGCLMVAMIIPCRGSGYVLCSVWCRFCLGVVCMYCVVCDVGFV